MPSGEKGRKALEAALNAWKEGQPPAATKDFSPPVQVSDADWLGGKKLEGYEILGEETDAEGLPWFSVSLHFAKPKGSKEVRYVVKGGALLWVFQEDDYKGTVSWHGYKQEKKEKKK